MHYTRGGHELALNTVSGTKALWPQSLKGGYGLILYFEKQSKLAHVLLTASLAQLFPVCELGTLIDVQYCNANQAQCQ